MPHFIRTNTSHLTITYDPTPDTTPNNAEPTTSNHPIATESTLDILPDTPKSNPGTHLIATEPTNHLKLISTEHSAKSSLHAAATAAAN